MKTALDNVGATKAYKYQLQNITRCRCGEEGVFPGHIRDRQGARRPVLPVSQRSVIRKDPAARITDLLKKVFK